MDARLAALAHEVLANAGLEMQRGETLDLELQRRREVGPTSVEARLHRERLARERRGAGIPSLFEQARELRQACEDKAWLRACELVEDLLGRLALGEWRPDQLFWLPGWIALGDAPGPLRDQIEELRARALENKRQKTWREDECWERRRDPEAPERARALARACGLHPQGGRVGARATTPASKRRGERIVLIDADNLIHRIFYATPLALAPIDNTTPINAVVGWVRHLRALRRRLRPSYVIPIFDGHETNWRRELLPTYKSTRKPPPSELTVQWDRLIAATEALRLPVVRVPELEADDLIGAYAEAAVAIGLEVLIVSNDKDLLQLVRGPHPGAATVRQIDPFAGTILGPAEVFDRFGVGPEQLGDLLALAGDRGDNIPGVPGIGPKTAATLLRTYGDLEEVLAHAEEITQPKRREQILEHTEAARLSRRIVALRTDVELPIPLSAIDPWRPSKSALDTFFAELGFGGFRAVLDPGRSR